MWREQRIQYQPDKIEPKMSTAQNNQKPPHLLEHGVSKRFFFREGDCDCFTIESHLNYMIENNIEIMNVWLAKRETKVSHFYCKHYQEIGDKTENICGKWCGAYDPKNKKSGACVHLGYTYEITDKSYELKVDSVKFES